MTATIIPHDPDADTVRQMLKDAEQHGEVALANVGQRIRLLCDCGDILEKRKEAGDLVGWLDLHFGDESPNKQTVTACITFARERKAGKLDLETRTGLVKAMSMAGMLPGFDGPQGLSKKPVSYITPLSRLHVTLQGLRPWEWSDAERRQVKERLRPIMEVYEKL